MEIMPFLKSFIYVASSALFLPVLLLLTLLILWMTMYCGSFFSMWLRRRRLPKDFDHIEALRARNFSLFPAAVTKFAEQLVKDDGFCDEVAILNLLRDSAHHSWKSLDPLRIIIRIGPGLGLIGTLIPMGTGLASLGQGDLSRLSGDLVVAFTTTVVGMALGLLSYLFFTVQHRWVEEDVKNMELCAQVLADKDDGR